MPAHPRRRAGSNHAHHSRKHAIPDHNTFGVKSSRHGQIRPGWKQKRQHSRHGYDARRHEMYLRDIDWKRIVDLQLWAGQTILFQRQVKRIQA